MKTSKSLLPRRSKKKRRLRPRNSKQREKLSRPRQRESLLRPRPLKRELIKRESRRFKRQELLLTRLEKKPRLRPKNSEMLPEKDKRRSKRLPRRLNLSLTKLSTKLSSIDSLLLLPSKKLKMPKISKELRRDSKLMPRE